MAWGKQGSTTLTSAGTSLDIASYTSSKTDQFLCHDVGTSSSAVLWQFGGSGSVDTGNNYALRYNQQGGTDGTQTSRGNIWAYQSGSDDDRFMIWYGCNVSSQEKLFIGHSVTFNGSGSSVVPDRCESVGKWTNTSVQYDTVKAFSNSGNMDIGSNITALGSDITPVPIGVVDGTVFYDTDLNKEYVLYNGAWTEL